MNVVVSDLESGTEAVSVVRKLSVDKAALFADSVAAKSCMRVRNVGVEEIPRIARLVPISVIHEW